MKNSFGDSYEHDLLQWRSHPECVGVRVLRVGSHARCDDDFRYEGCYRMEDAPDYPICKCANESCLYYWEVIFSDETDGVIWKTPEKRHAEAGGYIEKEYPPSTPESLRDTIRVLNRTVLKEPISEEEMEDIVAEAFPNKRKQVGALNSGGKFLGRLAGKLLRIVKR